MLWSLFHGLIYQPIYNVLALAVSVVPGGDMGIAIILVTFFVRLILLPFSLRASHTQRTMRDLDPHLKALREEHKDKKEELAKKTMALFSEHKVNPFAGFLLLFIQLPIILGLYYVFWNGGETLSFDPSLLYPSVPLPETISFFFLGLIDLTKRSIVLAVIVAATQFVYAYFLSPPSAAPEPGAAPSFKDDLARSMNLQMRYVFPLLLGGIAYYTTAAIALYFVASNVFGILQELVVQKTHKSSVGAPPRKN